MKSENTYNQKLAHCVRWHQHLKLSFSRLLHYQPLLVCAVRNCVNWNTPIHVASRKRWCDLWNWSETKETVASQSNLVGVLCGSCVGLAETCDMSRETREWKNSRERRGPRLTLIQSFISSFICLQSVTIKCFYTGVWQNVIFFVKQETRLGEAGEERRRKGREKGKR